MKPRSKIEHLRTLVEGVKSIPIKHRVGGDGSDSRLNESSFEFNAHDTSNVQSEQNDNYNRILDASAFETRTTHGPMRSDLEEDQMLRNLDEPDASTRNNKDATEHQVESVGRKSADEQDGDHEERLATHSEHAEHSRVLHDDVSETSLHKPKSRVGGKKLPIALPTARPKMPMRSKPKLQAPKAPGVLDFSLKQTHEAHHEEGHKHVEPAAPEQQEQVDAKAEGETGDKGEHKNEETVKEEVAQHDDKAVVENEGAIGNGHVDEQVSELTNILKEQMEVVKTKYNHLNALPESNTNEHKHAHTQDNELENKTDNAPNDDKPAHEDAPRAPAPVVHTPTPMEQSKQTDEIFDFATQDAVQPPTTAPERPAYSRTRTANLNASNNFNEFVDLKNAFVALKKELKDTKHELDNYKRICSKYIHDEQGESNTTADEYENTILHLREENEKLKEALANAQAAQTENGKRAQPTAADADYESLIDELKRYYNKLFADNNVIIHEKEGQIVKLVNQNKQLLAQHKHDVSQHVNIDGISDVLRVQLEEFNNADEVRLDKLLESVRALDVNVAQGGEIDVDVSPVVVIKGADDDVLRKAYEFIDSNKVEFGFKVDAPVVVDSGAVDAKDEKVDEDEEEQEPEASEEESVNEDITVDPVVDDGAEEHTEEVKHEEHVPEVQERPEDEAETKEVDEPKRGEKEEPKHTETEEHDRDETEETEQVQQLEHQPETTENLITPEQQEETKEDVEPELQEPEETKPITPDEATPLEMDSHIDNNSEKIVAPKETTVDNGFTAEPAQPEQKIETEDTQPEKMEEPVKKEVVPPPRLPRASNVFAREVKPEVKPETKPEVKPEAKQEVKPEIKAEPPKVEARTFKPLVKRKLKVTQLNTETGLFDNDDNDGASVTNKSMRDFNDNASVALSDKNTVYSVAEKPSEPSERKVTNIFTQARVARPPPRPPAK